jgi:hypothetical protein
MLLPGSPTFSPLEGGIGALSAARETTAFAWAVSPEAGMRLLDEYVRTRLGQG